jgi:hypothetical protein
LPIDLEAAVLRYPTFGDIELRQDLDARDQLFGGLVAVDSEIGRASCRERVS